MAELHVARAFCRPEGGGGDALGVFLDGNEIADDDRQRVATELGFSGTVFVDDAARGLLRIFTPATELRFAPHPLVGTAWLLARERQPLDRLRPPAGEVAVRAAGGLTFVVGAPGWAPGFEFVRVDEPDEVDRLEGPPGGERMVGVWAWVDEQEGVIRQRVFAPGIGIAEDEATGTAALRLSAMLDRAIDIRQGRDSRIVARPVVEGMVEVGGRVELDEVRAYPG